MKWNKINCFSTVIAYFNNEIRDGSTSAQRMLEWLNEHTTQVNAIGKETIVVIWSSSNPVISPNEVLIAELARKETGYPFGLIMEHAAVFLSPQEVFQKASPKDEDRFEILEYKTMLRQHEMRLPWMRITLHMR
jgi:hypothetical protein